MFVKRLSFYIYLAQYQDEFGENEDMKSQILLIKNLENQTVIVRRHFKVQSWIDITSAGSRK